MAVSLIRIPEDHILASELIGVHGVTEHWFTAPLQRTTGYDMVAGDHYTYGAGDTVHWSDVRAAGDSDWCEGRAILTFDYTAWGDYVGSMVERSNCRAMLEDFPETFVEVRGDYGSKCLAVFADAAIPELVADVIRALAEYPLYSDEDHSNLEMEETEEAWEQYAESDLTRELERFEFPTADLPAYAVELLDTPDAWQDIVDSLDSAWLRERFYSHTVDADQYPYGESAVNIVFPCWDDTVKAIALEMIALCTPCTAITVHSSQLRFEV